jgi:hypothetical protein
MPTREEREYYQLGFQDGVKWLQATGADVRPADVPFIGGYAGRGIRETKPKTRRKLSAWNKFVKANSKKPRFVLRSGKLNLKKMGVAFRKTPLGKKKRR